MEHNIYIGRRGGGGRGIRKGKQGSTVATFLVESYNHGDLTLMHDEGWKRVRGDGRRGERNLEWYKKQMQTCAAAARAACCTSLDSSSARYSWARATAEAAPKRPARAHMRCSPPLVRAHKRQAVPPAPTCIALRNTYDMEKKRKDYGFQRQFNEKPSIVLGCPAHTTYLWVAGWIVSNIRKQDCSDTQDNDSHASMDLLVLGL